MVNASAAEDLARGVALEFRRRVLEEYVPRIHHCVALLSEEQLWHKPGSHGNSVANLLLHLAGNTRQWILSGVSGQDDGRDRDGEFAAIQEAESPSGEEMMAHLTATVEAAMGVIDGLSPADFLRVKVFQSRWEHTCLSAVLHVMEHFSGHAGQIYAFTKQTLDVDLKFWDL
jgi:uncharacterized damage-inducible protein DinB